MSALPQFPACSLPPGEIERYRETAHGRLRTLHWPVRGGEQRRILFLGGKRDFMERHAESYHRFLDQGYALAALDWRGQGLSARGAGRSIDLFDQMEADLARMIGWAAETLGGPLTIAAHSMGGHVALRTLAANDDSRALTERLVLFAPMLGIVNPWIDAVAARVARRQVRRGRGEAYPPGQYPYGPVYRSEARRRRLTGDTRRFAESFVWVDKEPGFEAGGATWGWLAAACESNASLRPPRMLGRIDMPALILLGTKERVVDAGAIRRAAAYMPNATLVGIDGGRHELQLDSDAVQARLWPPIWEFLSA